MKRYIFLIFFLILPPKVFAGCNFKTADYIDQLNDSSYIKSIEIITPNSRKYAKNQIKILASKSKNIPPKMRKKHNANILVNYKFGQCKYYGKIWQNGDWKDHIKINNGKINSSLNVKLKNGNILNAVKFKLFLPDTRRGINEILGTLILKKHNFIVPETFETLVSVNNDSYMMLFQEDSQKELLERNLKREGPIFEGDETLIWSNDENEELLGAPNLSKLINYKSSIKGKNTLRIYLDSYHKLQSSYLFSNHLVDPNIDSKIFEDYSFLMLSLNGHHGLFKTNQKYYYNLLTKNFEPIYYDGMFTLKKDINKRNDFKKYASNFSKNYKYQYLNNFRDEKFIKELEYDFASKLTKYGILRKQFFKESIAQIISNQNSLNFKIKNISTQNRKNNQRHKGFLNNRLNYVKKYKSYDEDLLFISDYKINQKNIIFSDNFKNEYVVNFDQFSRILSRKKYLGKSFIFLPNKKIIFNDDKLYQSSIPSKGVTIFYHPDSNLLLDLKNKSIIFNNVANNIPVIISGGNLTGWSIKYTGDKKLFKENKYPSSERINSYGYTGCLNFINTKFNMTDILVNDARCEDSVNIINSKGIINSLKVNNAFHDGLDADFSNLNILNATVKGSGNDCIDFSSGYYTIDIVNTSNCSDKSISAGEKSNLKINIFNSKISNIALAGKDSSKIFLNKAKIMQSKFCLSAYQKKQEFGGSLIKVNEINCDGEYYFDKNSIISF